MAALSIQEERVKELVKQALLELFQEQKDLLSEIMAEALEDIGLANAIREGEAEPIVPREQVMEELESSD